MQAFEFQSTVEDGAIHIPEQYRDKIHSTVRVLVFTQESPEKISPEFSAIRLRTKGFQFDRKAANER